MARITGTTSKNGYLWFADVNERFDNNYVETNKSIVDYTVYIQNQGKRFNTGGWTKRAGIDGVAVWEELAEDGEASSSIRLAKKLDGELFKQLYPNGYQITTCC